MVRTNQIIIKTLPADFCLLKETGIVQRLNTIPDKQRGKVALKLP